jgi:broad specificity phosphatase PhoE
MKTKLLKIRTTELKCVDYTFLLTEEVQKEYDKWYHNSIHNDNKFPEYEDTMEFYKSKCEILFEDELISDFKIKKIDIVYN